MKYILLIILIFIGCNNTIPKWEYKVERFIGSNYDRTGENAAKPSLISITDSKLNELGEDGWELVSTSMEMETAYVNFGKKNM